MKVTMLGNWKMNQSLGEIEIFFSKLKTNDKVYCGIAPQFPHLLHCIDQRKDASLKIGAQNCSHQLKGAFTGDVSVACLKEIGTDFVIIGHSERRHFFGENHGALNQKVKNALDVGLQVVFCIGETLEEREADKVEFVLGEQLREGLKDLTKEHVESLIIAYEPVWAIGTGKTASPDQANEAHLYTRQFLAENFNVIAQNIPLLYGGSVKPSNVDELLEQPHIDGALVGGASLKAEDFNKLIESAAQH